MKMGVVKNVVILEDIRYEAMEVKASGPRAKDSRYGDSAMILPRTRVGIVGQAVSGGQGVKRLTAILVGLTEGGREREGGFWGAIPPGLPPRRISPLSWGLLPQIIHFLFFWGQEAVRRFWDENY